MSDVDIKKPTEDMTAVAALQLPAVIDKEINLKPVYLHDIYTGKPGFVVILSDRFNELSKEEAISPDFSDIENLGYKVEIRHWHPIDRKFDLGNNYDNLEGMFRCITLYPRDNIDLIEDAMLIGLDKAILPLVNKVQTNMEKQLDTELQRLQKLHGRAPK
jgi:hypothetical protein